MTSVRCSRGHLNPSENRFCALCGEKLSPAASGYQGFVLGDRYQIVRQIGYGGFGRTYLAEDINRFNEPCVLKEFAPQVQGTYALEKAEELFEREAGVLYRLQHPQIPRFREMFRAKLDDRSHLFLVQDYVDGRTYRQLLEARKSQGLSFSELEVRRLLEQILPVLQYLHTFGVIHRDISPDNLILRSADQLPVLIDFGGVKQVAVDATSLYVPPHQASPLATRLGKLGYAPEEQLRNGVVSPQSDLHALAMTALVLLSSKEPLELLEGRGANWQDQIPLSPELTAVLVGMLELQSAAFPTQNRYRSAQDVLQALEANSGNLVNHAVLLEPSVSHSPGFSPDPDFSNSPTDTSSFTPALKQRRSSYGVLLLLVGLGAAGWWTRDRWLPLLSSLTSGLPKAPPKEQPAQNSLQNRSQTLQVDYGFLVKLTDATFHERYPEQQGRSLSDSPDDAQWRLIWNSIANEWLTLLKQNVSAGARSRLGSYTQADRERWKQEVNQLYVGSRSLFALTDARFFHLFPQQRGKEFLEQPIGQVWQAIAADQVKGLQDGKTLERIRFDSGAFSKQVVGSLAPAEGRVYIANLSEGQIMRLNLQAPSQSTTLSIYLPRSTSETPFLLEGSAETTWTGTLPQSGYYEIVVVAHAAEPVSYQLNLAVDNVTSTPVEPEKPEAPEAKN
jgi:serine/threonine-protein kinase